MTQNSYLCCFLNEYPDNWESLLTDKYNIRIKRENNLVIFNYTLDSDFSDPIVQESRGIIINIETLNVVCWPFRKFGNYQEGYVDTIDWNTARVQDKIDGSIMKLWYPVNTGTKTNFGNWKISTNSMISPEQNFVDLFKSADNANYLKEELNNLNPDLTYIFELVSPDNRIVINYPFTHLYHIGTRNNKTGEELIQDIGIEKPTEYPIHTLDECISAAINLNNGINKSTDIKKEGFVVVDGNWHRIKVKSPEYLALHRFIANDSLNKSKILKVIRNKTISIDDFCEIYPQKAYIIKYYDFKIEELKHNVDEFIRSVRNLYEEFSHDRKAIANCIKGHPLAYFGFKAIGNSDSTDDLLDSMTDANFEKFIPDYKSDL